MPAGQRERDLDKGLAGVHAYRGPGTEPGVHGISYRIGSERIVPAVPSTSRTAGVVTGHVKSQTKSSQWVMAHFEPHPLAFFCLFRESFSCLPLWLANN